MFDNMTWQAWTAFACVLEWAIVHVAAGFIVGIPALKGDVTGVHEPLFSFIAKSAHWRDMKDGGDAKTFRKGSFKGWPYMSHRILFQHGINLFNSGIATLIGCWAIATGNRYMWLLCLPGWMFDYGYFFAVDTMELGALYAEAQTYIISIGMICAGQVTVTQNPGDVGVWEKRMLYYVPCLLIFACVTNKVLYKVGYWKNPITKEVTDLDIGQSGEYMNMDHH